MSDLEQLGIGLSYHRPGEDPERAATIRAALAGISPEPGAGVVIPLPRPAAPRLGITLSLHAYGLVGSYLVARASLADGPLEVVIHADDVSRTVAAFPPTVEGYREADACARGAIEALKIVVGTPVTPDPKRVA